MGLSTNFRSRAVVAVLSLCLGVAVNAKAAATKYYWSPVGYGGGTTAPGTWDTTTANWLKDDKGSALVWPGTAGDNDAYFSTGTAATDPYTVTVSGLISVDDMYVDEGNVTLVPFDGASGLSLTGDSDVVIAAGNSLTISCNVDLNGSKLRPDGTVYLLGNLTLSDKLEVKGGTTTVSGTNTGTGGVKIDADGAMLVIGSSSAMGDGGTFEWGKGTVAATNGNQTIGSAVAVTWKKQNLVFTGSDNLTFAGAVDLQADTNKTITVDGPGVLTFSGAVAGDKSTEVIRKAGAGTLVLSGTADTYIGTTTVLCGTLLVDNTHTGGDSYSVAPNVAGQNATLGGTGILELAATKTVTLTGVSETQMAILAPGDGGVGTLKATAQSLTFSDYSRFAVDVSGSTADKLVLTGNLNLTSTLDQLSVTDLGAGSFDGTPYTILTYTGTRSGTFDNVTGLDGTGYSVFYNDDEKSIQLVPEPAALAVLLLGGVGVVVRRRRRA